MKLFAKKIVDKSILPRVVVRTKSLKGRNTPPTLQDLEEAKILQLLHSKWDRYNHNGAMKKSNHHTRLMLALNYTLSRKKDGSYERGQKH